MKTIILGIIVVLGIGFFIQCNESVNNETFNAQHEHLQKEVDSIKNELIANVLILLSFPMFYLIKRLIDFVLWFAKLLLSSIFGSVSKGLSVLFIAFSILIIYYLYTSGKWLKLYVFVESLFSFL